LGIDEPSRVGEVIGQLEVLRAGEGEERTESFGDHRRTEGEGGKRRREGYQQLRVTGQGSRDEAGRRRKGTRANDLHETSVLQVLAEAAGSLDRVDDEDGILKPFVLRKVDSSYRRDGEMDDSNDREDVGVDGPDRHRRAPSYHSTRTNMSPSISI
jgi:hypothetical protein